MYEWEPEAKIRTRLRQLKARSTCTRRKVAAVAVSRHKAGMEILAEGWNLERDGWCKKDCPRASAVGVVDGVSRYDSGPTRCISIHAEEMVLRSLVGLGIRPRDVSLIVSQEPCYKCRAMCESRGLSWNVLYT